MYNKKSESGQQNQSGQGRTHAESTMGAGGFDDLSRQYGGLSPLGTDGALQDYLETGNTILTGDSTGDGKSFKLLPISGADAGGIEMSSLALVKSVSDVTVAFVYVVEASMMGGGLEPMRYPNPVTRGDVFIPSTAGDYLRDDDFFPIIRPVIATQLGKKEDSVIIVSGTVIPEELKADNAASLKTLLFSGTNAINQYLNAAGYIDANINISARRIAQESIITQRIEFDSTPATSAQGLPVRKQIGITTTASKKGGQAGLNKLVAVKQRELGMLTGFIDFQYRAPACAMNVARNPEERWHYDAIFTITSVTPKVGFLTPQVMLLSLSSAWMIQRDGFWYNAFRPQYGNKKGVNYANLKGLSHEIQATEDTIGLPGVDSEDGKFNHVDFLRTVTSNAVVYRLHIDETGPDSWLTRLFIDAAQVGSPAYEKLIDEANILTDGRFSQYFQKGSTISMVEDHRIPLGYFEDGNNGYQDRRSLDYLAIQNLTDGKDKLGETYSQTYETNTGSAEMRLETRLQIEKEVAGPSLKLKGYATSVLLHPDFIIALKEALTDCNFDPRVEGNYDRIVESNRGHNNMGTFGVSQDVFRSQRPSFNSSMRGNNFGGFWGGNR